MFLPRNLGVRGLLEPTSKMRLGVQCCVAGRLKMLTEESELNLKVI